MRRAIQGAAVVGLAVICVLVLSGLGLAFVGARPFDGVEARHYLPGALISFGKDGNAKDYLLGGWGPSDKSGHWTRDPISQVQVPFSLAGVKAFNVQLIYDMRPDAREGVLYMQVLVNGRTVLNRTFNAAGRLTDIFSVPVDPSLPDGKVVVTFLQDSGTAPIFEDGGDWLHVRAMRLWANAADAPKAEPF